MRTVQELLSLKGRTAVITGASGVLGRVMAGTLSELELLWFLWTARNRRLAAQSKELASAGTSASYRVCDLESQSARQDLIRDLMSGPRPGILINNAAFVGDSKLQGWTAPFEEQTVETWRRAVEVNLTAPFELSQGLAPALLESGHGSIINIASLYGHMGPDWRLYEGTAMGNPAAYAASKGGLIQLTRWLATTLAPGIRVNAISPGGFARSQPASFVQRYEDRTPLHRMAREEDLKGAVAYLAGDLSCYITGQNLLLDGGWSIW
jgi:NAD(P)-dependent dehydrogenase (short-subunit alcohol dehydrogenase family)